jgi:hypothetical protein
MTAHFPSSAYYTQRHGRPTAAGTRIREARLLV